MSAAEHTYHRDISYHVSHREDHLVAHYKVPRGVAKGLYFADLDGAAYTYVKGEPEVLFYKSLRRSPCKKHEPGPVDLWTARKANRPLAFIEYTCSGECVIDDPTGLTEYIEKVRVQWYIPPQFEPLAWKEYDAAEWFGIKEPQLRKRMKVRIVTGDLWDTP